MYATVQKIFVYLTLYAATALLIASTVWWGPNERDDFPIFRLFIIIFSTILLTKYFFYMTLSPWYDTVMQWKHKKHLAKRLPPYNPRVSVIIPAWNEMVGLVKTVESVLQSTYRNIEIIVVNDGSTDESDARMRAFLTQYEAATVESLDKIKIIYGYKDNGGKGRALNEGLQLSSGEIIITIDADCALLPGTVGNFVKRFEDPAVSAAVGNVKIGNPERVFGIIQQLEFLFSFYFKKADSLLNTIYIIGGAAGAYRREVFDKIGVFSEHNITEDIDLSVRIQEAGMRIVYAADAVVYTEGAGTFSGLAAQRLRWKRGRFQTFHEHRGLFFSSKKRHNKLLTHLILPLAVFGDTQLFFEVLFLCFLYTYSLLTHDFSSFLSGIIVVSSMFLVQMFDDRSERGAAFYLLAPIGWLLFYITTIIEYRALVKSLWDMAAKRKLTWQKWERVGLSKKIKSSWNA